jgi:hypothetical protein
MSTAMQDAAKEKTCLPPLPKRSSMDAGSNSSNSMAKPTMTSSEGRMRVAHLLSDQPRKVGMPTMARARFRSRMDKMETLDLSPKPLSSAASSTRDLQAARAARPVWSQPRGWLAIRASSSGGT